MSSLLGFRGFSLTAQRAAGGIYCGADGVFVDDIPLLCGSSGERTWSVRPIADLNDELSVRYRLPVDIAAKANALALIACALNRGDLAMASIAVVQMQLPHPPALGKEVESEGEISRRALELYRGGLLKGDWDPTKHPRTGTKPNPGWFATVPKEPKLPVGPTGPKIPRRGWPQPHVNRAARDFVKWALRLIVRYAGRYLLFGLKLHPFIRGFLLGYTPVELNQGEDRLTAQIKAALQSPKTFEELQQMPTEDLLGYELHHIVEQNPGNLAKIIIEKFGRERLDDPRNLVWIPRFLHEEITGYYNGNLISSGGPTVRQFANGLGFEQQREFGLDVLRKYGVLK